MSLISERISNRKKDLSVLDVRTNLKHFSLINYQVPKERLLKYIPEEFFEIPEFEINGKKMALMSAVPFFDEDFYFPKISKKKFSFMQTNYRVYIIDKKTNEHAVWFFGTTLGSYSVYIPKIFFKIPWHYSKYKVDFEYNTIEKRYYSYEISSKSNSIFGEMRVSISDTGKKISSHEGFKDYNEMKLILTHPVSGYFYRNDKRVGTYSIWHDEMDLNLAKANDLYFAIYENLGLLSKEEMQKPISIFLTPEIFFEVYLPPKQYYTKKLFY
jgi:hypothetical protein